MLTLLGLSNGRERGDTSRTGEVGIGAGISGGAPRMEKAFAQGEMGRELLTPAIRGSVCLGLGMEG